MGVADDSLKAYHAFDDWLAAYLQQEVSQIRILLSSPVATHFLIAWALFEAKCCGGHLHATRTGSLADKVVTRSEFRKESFEPIARYFHERYQNTRRLRTLMHGRSSQDLERILSIPFSRLSDAEVATLLLWVVYRYRNNIFHGNKKVESWLRFEGQIRLCTTVLQAFVFLCDRSAGMSA